MVTLRKVAWRVCVAVAVLTAANCAASPAGRNHVRSEAPIGAVDAGELRFDALTPQPLPSGVCGLYLWARSAQEPVFVLAAYSTPAEAHVRLRGRDRSLRRTAAEGAAAFGHYEMQTFSDGRLTFTVEADFDDSGRLRDGAAIERGVIRVTDRDGVETIIPVGGLVACEP